MVSQRTFRILEVENLKEIEMSQKIEGKVIDTKFHNPMLISMNFFPEAKRCENCKRSLGQQTLRRNNCRMEVKSLSLDKPLVYLHVLL